MYNTCIMGHVLKSWVLVLFNSTLYNAFNGKTAWSYNKLSNDCNNIVIRTNTCEFVVQRAAGVRQIRNESQWRSLRRTKRTYRPRSRHPRCRRRRWQWHLRRCRSASFRSSVQRVSVAEAVADQSVQQPDLIAPGRTALHRRCRRSYQQQQQQCWWWWPDTAAVIRRAADNASVALQLICVR